MKVETGNHDKLEKYDSKVVFIQKTLENNSCIELDKFIKSITEASKGHFCRQLRIQILLSKSHYFSSQDLG